MIIYTKKLKFCANAFNIHNKRRFVVGLCNVMRIYLFFNVLKNVLKITANNMRMFLANKLLFEIQKYKINIIS